MDIDDDNDENIYYYKKEIKKLKNRNSTTLRIDLNHLNRYDATYTLSRAVVCEFYRYQPSIENAIKDVAIIIDQEWGRSQKFYVSFYNISEIRTIRQLRTYEIGKLISISGTITRTSEVKPELIKGTFLCKMCNSEIKGVKQQFRYTEPKTCINPNCNNRTKWKLVEEESEFADWQKLRLQENPNDIPTGSMPRSIDVILRNELVEACKPGDKCSFVGNLIVVPDIASLYKPGENVQQQIKRDAMKKEQTKISDGVSGLKNLGIKDMNYKLIFIANGIIFKTKENDNCFDGKEVEEDMTKLFTSTQLDKINEMKNNPYIYSELARSIAPNVYGHDEVKKGILLMLVGGVNKETGEGIKLRGDINICLVGDPSTAKSQFLKYVCQLVPRAVYTSGKGSSAAGLTAGVVRDAETGEFCIEVGALMLADNGICCIDEFDKMESKDQVAIHEAMEQQTISIAKAGIHATLMTRTSILAAANPVFGRYDRTKPLKTNIDISAPIMSRFDLFFIILDDCHSETDFNIAQHIINLQKYGDSENDNDLNLCKYSQEDLEVYIRYAKHTKPVFTKESADQLRKEYIKLRKADISSQKTSYRITVRQLESLIRLSEALAKIQLSKFIEPLYVKEASRLLKTSIINVDMGDENLDYDNEIAKNRQNDAPYVDPIIPKVDYLQFRAQIIATIHNLEDHDIRPTIQKVIETIMESKIDDFQTQEESLVYIKKLNLVIKKLIEKDGVIFEAEDEATNEKYLTVNLQYDVPIGDQI